MSNFKSISLSDENDFMTSKYIMIHLSTTYLENVSD